MPETNKRIRLPERKSVVYYLIPSLASKYITVIVEMDLRFLNRPFFWGVLFLLIGSILSGSYAATPIRGPDVTIIAAEEELLYEFRQNGRLTMIMFPNGGSLTT